MAHVNTTCLKEPSLFAAPFRMVKVINPEKIKN